MLHEQTPAVPTVPEILPRLTATMTALSLAAVLLGAPAWILAALIPDFALRALDLRRWSPLGWLARRLVAPRLPHAWRRAHTAWPPKRFAARIGVVFLSGTLVAYGVAPATVLGPMLAAMMLALCTLEAAFGFCMACRMYGLLGRFGWVTGCENRSCRVPQGQTPPSA